MSDDPERKLDEFYRRFDDPARRLHGRWNAKTEGRAAAPARVGPLGYVLGAAAAAAAVLVLLWTGRPQPPPDDPKVVSTPVRGVPPPEPAPPPKPEAPRPDVAPSKPAPPSTPEVSPPEPSPLPKLDPPRRVDPRPPEPAPEPSRREEPRPTTTARAAAVLREVEGAFEIGDRPLRGKQKGFPVTAGDRLKSASVVKLTLADDRFLLLSPKSAVELRPEEKSLAFHLEQGEILAELVGPGTGIRVTTRACEVQPVGTVFCVRVEDKRTTVLVEKGKVEVRAAKGKSTVRVGESVQAMEDGALTAPAPADLRSLAWARAHRPAEGTLFFEDFNKPGAWEAEVAQGVAKGVPVPGLCAGRVHIESTRPPLFEVPLRGQVTIVYRTDRAAKTYVQIFASDARMNFRREFTVLRGGDWRTLTIDFDQFAPADKSKYSGRIPPGSPITDFNIIYGDDGDRGSIWVDSIKVTESRP